MQNDSAEIIKTVIKRCVQDKHIGRKGAVQIMNVQCTDSKQMYRSKHHGTRVH